MYGRPQTKQSGGHILDVALPLGFMLTEAALSRVMNRKKKSPRAGKSPAARVAMRRKTPSPVKRKSKAGLGLFDLRRRGTQAGGGSGFGDPAPFPEAFGPDIDPTRMDMIGAGMGNYPVGTLAGGAVRGYKPPALKRAPAARRGVSPIRKRVSPMRNREASPVRKRGASPVRKRVSPVRRMMSPSRKRISPVRRPAPQVRVLASLVRNRQHLVLPTLFSMVPVQRSAGMHGGSTVGGAPPKYVDAVHNFWDRIASLFHPAPMNKMHAVANVRAVDRSDARKTGRRGQGGQ